MDLASLQTTLITAIETAAGETSDTLSVYWADGPQRMRKPRSVRIMPVSLRRFGTAEKRHTEVGDQLQERVYGFRQLVLQLAVETDAQTLSLSALGLADQIQTGLRRRDVLATLSAIQFGLAEIRAVGAANYSSSHGRTKSAVVLELVLNTATAIQGELVDWIAATRWDVEAADALDNVLISETITVGTPDP